MRQSDRKYYYNNHPSTKEKLDSARSYDRTKEHQKKVDDLLFVLGSRPHIKIFVRPVGYDDENHIRYGIPGECDLDGVIGPYGIRFGIEVKTGNGKLNPKQKIWKEMLEGIGGIHITADKSVEEVVEELNQKYLDKLLQIKNSIDEELSALRE